MDKLQSKIVVGKKKKNFKWYDFLCNIFMWNTVKCTLIWIVEISVMGWKHAN